MKRFIGALTAAAFIASTLQANPVGDFFKRVGRTISKPPAPKPTPHRTRSRGTSNNSKPPDTSASPTATATPMSGASAPASPVPPPPPPSPSAEPSTPPPVVEQVAIREPRTGAAQRRDLPYGVPVPGRAGFVTSPYAPTRGYVDVREFPPGTEVRDPFSGKVFLTP
ncbi:MAG: hypothetical protein ABR526_09660 [Chthoniobacterales bacterium]